MIDKILRRVDVNFNATLTIVFVLSIAAQADANFDHALKQYHDKNYPQAYEMFGRMARIGYYPAQFNLGVMYFHGQGVETNLPKAYAWTNLAAEQNDDMKKTADLILNSLKDDSRTLALKEADELKKLYGLEVLKETLLPIPLADEDCEPDLIPIKQKTPAYPREALSDSQFGNVLVVFDIDDSGRAIKPEVLSGAEAFSESALKAITEFRYPPGRPVSGYIVDFRYRIANPLVSHMKHLQSELDKLREKADSGSAAEKYVYTIHAAGLHDIRPEQSVLNGYLLDAAQQGLAEAQFLLGQRLLFGRGCEVDTVKGLEWLKKAAIKEFAPAQYLLAKRIDDQSSSHDSSMLLLENAADSDHQGAMLDLAWFLATSSNEEDRDPVRALNLARHASKKTKDKVTGWNILAAAYAANGDFKKAQKYQKKAIKKASSLDWKLSELNTRLANYQAGKMWLESF